MNKPSVSAGVVAGVALGAAALGAAAVAVRAACLQVARTRNGLARVKRMRDEGGDEVRVLVQGGVYQSASYVGERWAEPVFAYYHAFDDVFEAEDAMRDAYGHGIDRMLMLGGGGFAYPKFALLLHEGCVWTSLNMMPRLRAWRAAGSIWRSWSVRLAIA